ncbi:unnamed protein product [Closterium sp. NIES-53]
MLASAAYVTASGIAPTYGYLKFSLDKVTVPVPLTPPEANVELRVEFRAAHLLTFMVISRCSLPVVQITLKLCRSHLDAGHQVWRFITSTYQATDDLYIGQLEEQLTHLRMGEQETATDHSNRARWLLANMRMAGVDYSTASDCDNDDTKGGRGRLDGRCPRRESKPRKVKQLTKSKTLAKDADSSSGDKGRGDEEASCSLVGVVEPTVWLAPEAGKDFKVVAATMQANPVVVLLDNGCSNHLMSTKDAFIDLGPSGNVKHMPGSNGALQDVQGRGTVALQGEAGKQSPPVTSCPLLVTFCPLPDASSSSARPVPVTSRPHPVASPFPPRRFPVASPSCTRRPTL